MSETKAKGRRHEKPKERKRDQISRGEKKGHGKVNQVHPRGIKTTGGRNGGILGGKTFNQIPT